MTNKKRVRCVHGPLDGKEWTVDVRPQLFVVPCVTKRTVPNFYDGKEPVEVFNDVENIVYKCFEWHSSIDEETQWYATPETFSQYRILDCLWRSHQNRAADQTVIQDLMMQNALHCDTIERLTAKINTLGDELSAAEAIITLLEVSHSHLVDDVRDTLGADTDDEDENE
jgi:hypothetical protein